MACARKDLKGCCVAPIILVQVNEVNCARPTYTSDPICPTNSMGPIMAQGMGTLLPVLRRMNFAVEPVGTVALAPNPGKL
jgi:hypothetical protein